MIHARLLSGTRQGSDTQPICHRLNHGATELAIWPEPSRGSVLLSQENPLERNVLVLSGGPCDAEVKSIAQDPMPVHK